MSSDPEGPSPPLQDELSPGRCPNCGRPLRFPENRPEGLCATCGIYVEILKPLALQSAPPLDRTTVQTALRRDLVRLCEERGLDPAGTKADLVRRLLDYLERSPAAGSEPGDAQGTPEPSSQSGDVAKRRETALFHLSLEQALEEPKEEPTAVAEPTVVAPPEPPATVVAGTATPALKPAEPPPALPAEAPPPEQPQAPPPEPTAPQEPVPTPEETGAPFSREFDDLFTDDEPPAPVPAAESEGAVEPEPSAEPEEPLEPEPSGDPEGAPPEEGPGEMAGPGVLELARAEPPSRAAEEASRVDEAAKLSARMRRDRAVFYVGVVSLLIGGIGLFLGSIIHDLLRVPVIGENYSVFGSLNVTAAALGGVFIIAGLCAIAFAVRGGIARARPLPGG